MVVEENGIKFRVQEKSFNQSFVLSGSGNIVPAICSTIRNNGVKFYQMNVKSGIIRQCVHLERAFRQ